VEKFHGISSIKDEAIISFIMRIQQGNASRLKVGLVGLSRQAVYQDSTHSKAASQKQPLEAFTNEPRQAFGQVKTLYVESGDRTRVAYRPD